VAKLPDDVATGDRARGLAELVKPFAPGWDERRLLERIWEIGRFYVSNSESEIPLPRRRKIERLAKALRDELAGLGGLDAGFLATLEALAEPHPVHLLAVESKSAAPRINRKTDSEVWGGPRRKGQRTLEGSILGMLVRAYFEASAKPGFSENGPLFRFANGFGELILGETAPFTASAVREKFRARGKKDGDALEKRRGRMREWMTFNENERRNAGLFLCPEGFDDPASKNDDPASER
jgi:hypothetical protein